MKKKRCALPSAVTKSRIPCFRKYYQEREADPDAGACGQSPQLPHSSPLSTIQSYASATATMIDETPGPEDLGERSGAVMMDGG